VGSPNRAPVASAGGPYEAAEGSELSFDASGTTDPDGNAVSYEWNFGDGGTATTTDPTVKPTHVYADNGSYAVTLKVTDAGGLTASATATATITNVAPTGQFVRPATAPENAKLVLSLAPVTDPGSADVIQYAFDCGDGKGYGALTATNNRPCVPADNGTVAVKAKVQDDDGGITEYTAAISVSNVAPTATLVLPTKAIPEGTSFSFSLTKPLDAGGDTPSLSYLLVCGSGPPVNSSSATCQTSDNGAFTVSAWISDKDGGQTVYTGTVNVVNVAPTVTTLVSLVTGPSMFGMRLRITDPAGVSDYLYYCLPGTSVCGSGFYTTVNWGDGSPLEVLTGKADARDFAVSHTYPPGPGKYTATLSASDDDGGTSSINARVLFK